MKTIQVINVENRQIRTNKSPRTRRCPLERMLVLLIYFVRWWISHRQPAEVAVMLRLVEIVGLVLIILILAAVGKIDEISKVINCFQVPH